MTPEKIPPQNWEITKNEVNLEEIRAASQRIRDIVPPTPVSKSIFQSQQTGLNVWFKLENFNVTGSFKIRGAANALRLASPESLKHGVIAASAGNHAQGVAYVSRQLGIKASIYMPERTPINKVTSTRGHGAEVILTGAVYDDAYAAALEAQKNSGRLIIHAFGDTAVINGQATIGLEILDQLPDLGAVLIPVGGGGLSGGIACAIKSLRPDIKIIGVQSSAFPAMVNAFKTKLIEPVKAGPTIADGIAVKKPFPRTLSLALKYMDDIIQVSEDEIAAAIMSLMEKDHLLSEGAGAVGVAALSKVSENLRATIGQKAICCIISGGNIDVNLLTKIVTRGQIASGRMMMLTVRTKDQPGQLADILKELSQTGANLIEVRHQRTFGATYYSDVDIEIELETSDFRHQELIRSRLDALGIIHN